MPTLHNDTAILFRKVFSLEINKNVFGASEAMPK